MAYVAIREAELGFERVVALIMNTLGVGLCIAARVLDGAVVEVEPECGVVVRTHGHHRTTGERVVVMQVGKLTCPPWE